MFFSFFQKRMQILLQRLTEFPFEPAPGFDWEDSIPFVELRRWLSLRQQPEKHPVARSLRTLMVEDSSYDAEVPLRQIGAVTASKGDYLMHLDRLPETMNLKNNESYGPLPVSEMERLKAAVFQEFGVHGERFQVVLQEWDQLHIAANSGASRRFALWRRLCGEQRHVRVLANVTPYRLNPELLRTLREECRAIGIKADWKLSKILNDAGETSKQFAYLDAEFPFQSDRAMLLVPYPHCFSKEQISDALALHHRLDLFFDLGRYFTECISVAEMKRSGGCANLG